MKRVLAALHVGLGALCALAAGASSAYTMLSYVGIYDSASIDVAAPQRKPCLLCSHALLNNILLAFVFYTTHSLLPRQWVKDALSIILPASIYRQFFFMVSTLTLFLVPYGWCPMPQLIWHLDTPTLRYVVYGISVCGLALTSVAFFTVQPLEFLGIQTSVSALSGSRQAQQSSGELVVKGVYGVVRHPMYSGLLIAVWSQPTMSQGRLLLAATVTLYLFLAVPYLEEPDLVQSFGPQYQAYMTTTGMFCPHLPTRQPLQKTTHHN